MPDRNVEYLFYQALLGAWPPELDPDDVVGMKSLSERVAAFMVKAVREAKQDSRAGATRTPTTRRRCQRFVAARSMRRGRTRFLQSSMVRQVAGAAWRDQFPGATRAEADRAGRARHLPGRRVVGFQPGRPRQSPAGRLANPPSAARTSGYRRASDLAEHWRDGREKLFVTHRLLALRRDHPLIFSDGDYQPLEVEGESADHLCAFARRHGGETVVVAVPRLVHRLYRGGACADWRGTELALPGANWRDVFTGASADNRDRASAADLFADFPVSVLLCESDIRRQLIPQVIIVDKPGILAALPTWG